MSQAAIDDLFDAMDGAGEDHETEDDEDGDDDDQAEAEENDSCVVVLPANADIVRVFERCAWQKTALSDGESVRMVPTDIAGTEIESVARQLGIPADRSADVLCGVRLMVAAAVPVLMQQMNP